MRLDRRKNVSVRVSTCINYDFKALTPVVWKLWRYFYVSSRSCITLSSQMTNDILSNVITGDETWCFRYDPKWKRQSLQLNQPTSPRFKNVRMSESQMMTLLITFFDIKGIVHFEFIPQDDAVTRLILWKYWSGYMKLCIETGLIFGLTIRSSIMTILQLTRRSLLKSWWPENRLLKWNTTPFPWDGPSWLLSLSKNKVCCYGTKIPGH
jgi:hypothetical protein